LVRRYKSFEKHLLWGEIVGFAPEGNLYVETEIILGETITGISPLNRIGLHERYSEQLHLWQRRAFHLRRVEPVVLNGTPRTKVVLDGFKIWLFSGERERRGRKWNGKRI